MPLTFELYPKYLSSKKIQLRILGICTFTNKENTRVRKENRNYKSEGFENVNAYPK